MSHEIKTLSDGARSVTVDGHEFDVDFDDEAVIENILMMDERIRTVTCDVDKTDPRSVLAMLKDMLSDAVETVELVLGEGSYVEIFGRKRPVMRTMTLIALLAIHAGDVYKETYKDYVPGD